MYLDDDIAVRLLDRHFDPARTAVRRGRGRVQRVVDQVADDRDQIARMPRVAVEAAVGRQSELDATLGGDRRFAEQERAEDGITDALEERFRQLLGHARRFRRHLDRLFLAPKLDEARNRVQPVGEIVRLRAQCLREAAGVVQLAQQALELGPIAEGRDVSNRSAAHHDRHPADHEHAVGRQHDFIGSGDLPDQQIADAARRKDVGERLADTISGQPQQPPGFVVDQRDAAFDVGGDCPFADAVQAGLPLFEERGDLARLQAEGLRLEPSREEN